MKAETLFDLSGRVAFVTGAASGLGLSMAEVLAANGASVALLDVDEAGLSAAEDKITAAGGTAETHVVDVGDFDRLNAVIDAIAEKHGRLDIAVANAGMSAGPGFKVAEGRMNAVDRERWNRVLDINLTGTFETVRAAARHMIPRREGRIIAVSSIAGLMAEEMVGYAYAVTKAGVVNLVRQAAMELAEHNVLVTGIAPGAVPHQHRRRAHQRSGCRQGLRGDRAAEAHRPCRRVERSRAAAGLAGVELHDRHHHSDRWRGHGGLAQSRCTSSIL